MNSLKHFILIFASLSTINSSIQILKILDVRIDYRIQSQIQKWIIFLKYIDIFIKIIWLQEKDTVF